MEQRSFEGKREKIKFPAEWIREQREFLVLLCACLEKRMGRIEVGGIAALPFILHFQQSGTSRREGRKKSQFVLAE